MPKKAQDFLVDTALGEKSYKISAPAEQEAVTLLRGTVDGNGAPTDLRRAEAEALASLILRDAGGNAIPVERPGFDHFR